MEVSWECHGDASFGTFLVAVCVPLPPISDVDIYENICDWLYIAKIDIEDYFTSLDLLI